MDTKPQEKQYKTYRVRKHAWLEAHIGPNRKLLLVNYTKNTGMNYEEYAKKLIDRDVRENPELYEIPKDLHKVVQGQNSIEDKIIAILRFKRKNLSLREITSTISKYDKSIDRSILRILAQNTLSHTRFFGIKNKSKHCVYGLSEWLSKEVKI